MELLSYVAPGLPQPNSTPAITFSLLNEKKTTEQHQSLGQVGGISSTQLMTPASTPPDWTHLLSLVPSTSTSPLPDAYNGNNSSSISYLNQLPFPGLHESLEKQLVVQATLQTLLNSFQTNPFAQILQATVPPQSAPTPVLTTQHAWSLPFVTGQVAELPLQQYITNLPGSSPDTPSPANHVNVLLPTIKNGQHQNWDFNTVNQFNGGCHLSFSPKRMNEHENRLFGQIQEPKQKASNISKTRKSTASKTEIDWELMKTLNLKPFFGERYGIFDKDKAKSPAERLEMVKNFLDAESLLHASAVVMMGVKPRELTAYLNRNSSEKAETIEMWYLFCIVFPEKVCGMERIGMTEKYEFKADFRTKNQRGSRLSVIKNGKHRNWVMHYCKNQKITSNPTDIGNLDMTFKNMNIECTFGRY